MLLPYLADPPTAPTSRTWLVLFMAVVLLIGSLVFSCDPEKDKLGHFGDPRRGPFDLPF